MNSRVAVPAFCLAMLALAWLPVQAGADDVGTADTVEVEPEAPRTDEFAPASPTDPDWIPSFVASIGLFGQGAKGHVTGNAPSNVGNGTETLIDGVIPLGLDLVMPRIPFLANARPFVNGGVMFRLGGKTKLASNDVLLPIPPLCGNIDCMLLNPDGLVRSARLDVEPGLRWYAGLGLQWTVTAGDYDVNIRPAVSYVGEQMDYKVHTVDDRVRAFAQPPDTVRFVVDKKDKATFHGVGLGLGFDTEVGRLGPIGIGLFAQGMGIYFFGTTVGEVDDTVGDAAINSFRWQVKTSHWAGEGTVGLRFSWMGL